jgi:hypothetical protein
VVGVRLGLKRIVEALEEDRGTSIGEVSHDAEEEGVGFPAAMRYRDEAKHVGRGIVPAAGEQHPAEVRRVEEDARPPLKPATNPQSNCINPITGASTHTEREREREYEWAVS